MGYDLFLVAFSAAAITAIIFENKILNQTGIYRERLSRAHMEARHAERLAKDYRKVAALWLDGDLGDGEFIEELSRLVAEDETPPKAG